MTDNLAIWNKLGKTDPDHTKGFKRGGGFTGTAIKPIYTEQKMTEVFGPCGTGWGFTEPRFELVPASEGQTAVYCWLSLWYVLDGKRSEPIPGVGGDFVVVKQSSGLRTNDEAFKAAFTDAIGNAMKHLGMSADVHMGLFDDSKYVRSLREDKEPAGGSIPSRGAGVVSSPAAPAPAITKEQAAFIAIAETFMMNATEEDELDTWTRENGPEAARLGFAKGSPAAVRLREIIERRRVEIREADLPAGQLEVAE